MTENLVDKYCVPCHKGTLPLKPETVAPLLRQLGEGWLLVDGSRLEKEYKFKNFARALIFVNRVGEVAEMEKHHPDIYLSWGKAKLLLWTHVANGLTENDFIIAAKSDEIYESFEKPHSKS